MEIFVHSNGRDFGPYTKNDILRLAREGQLKPSDLVWHKGRSNRVAYGKWIEQEAEAASPETWLTPRIALTSMAAGLALAGILAAAHHHYSDSPTVATLPPDPFAATPSASLWTSPAPPPTSTLLRPITPLPNDGPVIPRPHWIPWFSPVAPLIPPAPKLAPTEPERTSPMIYVAHNGNVARMPEIFDEYVPAPPPPPSLGNGASSFYAHFLAAGTTNQIAPATNAPVIPELKGIVVLGTIANVQTNGAPGVTGIQVKGPAFLDVKEARRKLASYLGKPATDSDLIEMRKELVRLCRAADRPVVDVVLPEQEVVDGVVQLVIVEGRLGQLEINNPDRQWTREQSLRDSVRIKPGDPLRQTRLLEDLDWINRNPFRDVTVSFRPGEVGETDVILNVDDRLPFRAYTRYDNHGMRALGKQQLAAGFNWQVPYTDNHFLNYEYLTDSHFNKLKAHVFSWEALLPWRHRLTFLGYYSESEADISSLYSGLSQKGDNWMNSLRYSIPLPRTRRYEHELAFGYDFKRQDNNLEYGGATVFEMPLEILQFPVSYTGKLHDRWGLTSFSLEAVYSPGELSNYNEDEDFVRSNRMATDSSYDYYRLNLSRSTNLPWDLNWLASFQMQINNDDKLPSSEGLGMGGYTTVRGYDERFVTGDKGYVLRNELYLPNWHPFSWVGSKQPDQLRFFGFADYGVASLNNYAVGDDSLADSGPNTTLASAGWGFVYKLRKNLSFRFEHAYQLKELKKSQSHSMAHFSLQLEF